VNYDDPALSSVNAAAAAWQCLAVGVI